MVALGDAAPSWAGTLGTRSPLQAPSLLAAAHAHHLCLPFPLSRRGRPVPTPTSSWNTLCFRCRARTLTNPCSDLTNGQCWLIKASLLWLRATAGTWGHRSHGEWLWPEQPVTSWCGPGVPAVVPLGWRWGTPAGVGLGPSHRVPVPGSAAGTEGCPRVPS